MNQIWKKKISRGKVKNWFPFIVSILLVFPSLIILRTSHRILGIRESPSPNVIAESLATFYHARMSNQKGSLQMIYHELPLVKNLEPCRKLKGHQTATINEDMLFWWGRQSNLCQLMRELKGVSNLQENGLPVLLNLVVNCTDLKVNHGMGTGNWLVAFYMARIAAAFSSVHLEFRCSAGDYKSEILPFLQGCYVPNKDQWPPNNVDEKLVCDSDIKTAPVHLAANEIRETMRHLVNWTTGFKRPALSVAVNTTMFGQIVFDEVAIHIRCGDILRLEKPRGDYGFTRYPEFKRRIPQKAKTIGIVTQSFVKSLNRKRDQEFTDDCAKIVDVLVKKLQADFPQSIVSVRNGSGETMTLSYTRLAVAEQTIVGLSSFGAFPILANYGTNYFEEGRMLVNKWLNLVPETMDGMIVMKNSDFLRNKHVMMKGVNFTMQWIAG